MAGFGVAGAATQGTAGMMGINVGQSQISQAVENPTEVNLQTQAPKWRNQFPDLPKVTRSAASIEAENMGRNQAMQTIDPTALAQQNALNQNMANTAGQLSNTSLNSGDVIAGLTAINRAKVAGINDVYAGANQRRDSRVNNFTNVILQNSAQEQRDVQDAARQDYLMNLAKAQQLLDAGRKNVIGGTEKVGDSLSSMNGMNMGGK